MGHKEELKLLCKPDTVVPKYEDFEGDTTVICKLKGECKDFDGETLAVVRLL